MSDKCSGDIDPFSDSPVLPVEWEDAVLLESMLWEFDGSIMSSKVCEGSVVLEVFFPRRGLTIGDCLGARRFRGFGADFLLLFLGGMMAALPSMEYDS